MDRSIQQALQSASLDRIRTGLDVLQRLQAGEIWTEYHWRSAQQLEKDIEDLVLAYERKLMNLRTMIEVDGYKVVSYPKRED